MEGAGGQNIEQFCERHKWMTFFNLPRDTKCEPVVPSDAGMTKGAASLKPNRVTPKVSLFTTADRCSLVITGFDASKV